METNKSIFENLLKKKLSNYELPYNNSDWLKLEKDLPAANSGFSGNVSGNFIKAAVIIGITIIAVVGIYLGVENNKSVDSTHKNKASVQDQQVHKNNIVDNSQVIFQNSDKLNIKERRNDNVNILNTDKKSVDAVNLNTLSCFNKSKENNLIFSQPDKKEFNNNFIAPKSNVALQEPNAGFIVDLTEGCEPLTVTFTPVMQSDSIEFAWNFGDGITSSQKSITHTYSSDGSFIPSLTVKYVKSKKKDSYSLSQPIVVKPAPNTDFVIETGINANSYIFTNRTLNAAKIVWQFGNGEESSEEIAKQTFKINGTYNIQLTATGFNACSKEFTKELKINVFSIIQFPNAFSPDGDGRNDFFGPIGENLSEYQFEMVVYNRLGQIIFNTKDAKNQWNGKVKGSDKFAEQGVYAYEVIIKDKNGNSDVKTGYVTLVKNK